MMPKREYCHCMRCEVPLEWATIKRVQTVSWYLELAFCDDCRKHLLKAKNPSICVQVDGDCLKTMLKAKEGQILVATTENA